MKDDWGPFTPIKTVMTWTLLELIVLTSKSFIDSPWRWQTSRVAAAALGRTDGRRRGCHSGPSGPAHHHLHHWGSRVPGQGHYNQTGQEQGSNHQLLAHWTTLLPPELHLSSINTKRPVNFFNTHLQLQWNSTWQCFILQAEADVHFLFSIGWFQTYWVRVKPPVYTMPITGNMLSCRLLWDVAWMYTC